MKIIKIGRGYDCQIILGSPKVSRCHAVLKVSPFGKMTITDMSSNGTKINGQPVPRGTEYPVKRNQTVSFADDAVLDWSQVPDSRNTIIGICAAAAALLVGIIVALFFFNREPAVSDDNLGGDDTVIEETTDESEATETTTDAATDGEHKIAEDPKPAPVATPAPKPAAKPAPKPAAKQPAKPAAKPAEQPAAKPAAKPAEKTTTAPAPAPEPTNNTPTKKKFFGH